MEHPLTNVYFNECCDDSGNTYPVTLFDVFREQQLAETWQSIRPGSESNEHWQRLVAAVPAVELAAVMEAWERLATALETRELTFAVSSPDLERDVAQRPELPLRGWTTGTPERPARQVAAPVLAFDLPAEIERMQRESGWLGGERDGKALVKEPNFRIVLTAMRCGTRLAQHEVAAPVSIHVLSGRLAVSIHDQTTELAAGHLLVLDRDIQHDVIALVDSAFMLTLAWPSTPRWEGTKPSSPRSPTK